MKFSGSFVIGKDENLRLNQFVAFNKVMKNTLVIGLIVLLPQLALPFLFEGELTVFRAFMALLISAAAAGLFFLIMRLSVVFRVRTFYKTETLTPFKQDLHIDSKGITATTEDEGAKFTSFDQIVKVTETSKDIYVFISATQAFVIPKNQLENEKADIASLKTIFSAAIPSDKVKFK